MRILSFLFLSLFVPTFCSAYTVVMKSGKLVQGILMGEDQSTLRLKDADGIVLSFKKTLLDEKAMMAFNANQLAAPVSASGAPSQPKISVRTYKKEDLERMPDLSLVQGQLEESVYEGLETDETPLERSDPKEESRWRNRAVSLKKDLGRLREKKIVAEASCAQARQSSASRLITPQKKPVSIIPLMGQPTACKVMEEVSRQLEEAEERWDIFETEARRAEVPWQWLE